MCMTAKQGIKEDSPYKESASHDEARVESDFRVVHYKSSVRECCKVVALRKGCAGVMPHSIDYLCCSAGSPTMHQILLVARKLNKQQSCYRTTMNAHERTNFY